MNKKIMKRLMCMVTCAIAIFGVLLTVSDVKAGGIYTQTVLQAVKEADSGCETLPPEMLTLVTSDTPNEAGNWTFRGTFKPVTGNDVEYELYVGAMEGDGSIYEKGIFTLPASALSITDGVASFSITPYWYGSYVPVSGETVYVALEAYVKTYDSSGQYKWLSTGWKKLNELTLGPEPSSDKNKLTVRFINQNKMTVHTPHIEFLDEGAAYSVDVPAADGYTCQYASSKVTGTMGNEDVTVDVPYIGKEVSLSIAYNYSNGTQAHEPVNATLKVGDSYSYPSPEIDKYKATPEKVEGYVLASDVESGINEQVVYSKDKYVLEVQYLLKPDSSDPDKVEQIKEPTTSYVEAGTTYKVNHEVISPYWRYDENGNYALDTDEVVYEGTMPEARHVVKLYYGIAETDCTFTFVKEDGTEVTAPYTNYKQRQDKPYVFVPPIVEGYVLRDNYFDGKTIRIPAYTFQGSETFTHTFTYYKNYKDTVHYRYADPAKGDEEVFPDDVYDRLVWGSSQGTSNQYIVPEKAGYIASSEYVSPSSEERKDNWETTVYYAPVTMDKGRTTSAGVPYKVYVDDSARDPFNPTDRYDVTLTPLWQWDIDRDEKNEYGASVWSSALVYIDGKYYKTYNSVKGYPVTEDERFKYLRGTTITINTGSDLIPASGSFTLTVYEKRNSGIFVKTDFDVDMSWAMGEIPADRLINAGEVTLDSEETTTSKAVFHWSIPDADSYESVSLPSARGTSGSVTLGSSGISTGSDKDDSGNTIYSVSYTDLSSISPEPFSFVAYQRAEYKEAEGFPSEYKWVKTTGTQNLCRLSSDEQNYSTREKSARITYKGYDSYNGYVQFYANWSTDRYIKETKPAHQALENYVEEQISYQYLDTIPYGYSGDVVNSRTGKVIGTATITKQAGNDRDCEALIRIEPSAILQNYLETGSGELSYDIYLQTLGVQVMEYIDGVQTPVGDPKESINVNYTWHPEGNSAGGYWTNDLGGDGERGVYTVALDDWTIISDSYDFSCTSADGTLYPNDCTIGRDGSFSLAWNMNSLSSNLKANYGRIRCVNKIYASTNGIATDSDALSGQGVYVSGYRTSNESGWEGCPGGNWISSNFDDTHSWFETSGYFKKPIRSSDYDYQTFTGGAAANVLVNLAGWYWEEDKGEGENITYGKVHFFKGSVRDDVSVSNGRTEDIISEIKVTKDEVKLVKEEGEDARITLDMEWTHNIKHIEEDEIVEDNIDPYLKPYEEGIEEDSMDSKLAASVEETHPLADNNMSIEIYPIGVNGIRDLSNFNGAHILYDSTYYIESFEKTDSGCKLKCKNLNKSAMDTTRIPDGYEVVIKYLNNEGTTIKTFTHRIMLEKDKGNGEVFFQIDDDGNAVVRLSSSEVLGEKINIDIYDNNGKIVKNGTLTGTSGSSNIYAYKDDIKGAFLEKDSNNARTQWFKLNVENVKKEDLAKYYVIVHGHDYDRNPFDESEKHYATAENFVKIEKASVNNGIFRIAYTLTLPEDGLDSYDTYGVTESSFNISSQDGKPAYVIDKEIELQASDYNYGNSTRAFSHAEKAVDNKDSTKLIYFSEENATDLLGDELYAKVSVKNPRYMSTKAVLDLKSEVITIEEQPLLSVTSASVDMMGNVKLAGTYDPDTVTLRYNSLKFNIICPDGYTWTNAINYNDNNFTYNDTAGTFSYDGKLFDVFRGAKAMEHYTIKDFKKLLDRQFKCSVSTDSPALVSKEIILTFGGKLKPNKNMISNVTYNEEDYLKVSVPTGYLEYGMDIDGLIAQAVEGNMGLLIVSDDNYSIAFPKATLTSIGDKDNTEISINDLTAEAPENVKKSELKAAGIYDFTLTNEFTGDIEVGLPTGQIPNGKTLEVYYVDADGKTLAMASEVVTDEGGASRAVFTTTHNSTYVVVYEGEDVDTDVTITFDANGGTGTMDPQVVEIGKATQLKANTFTRDGFTFAGWAESKDATAVKYADKATATFDADITLYAVWKESGSGNNEQGGGSGQSEQGGGSGQNGQSGDSGQTTTPITETPAAPAVTGSTVSDATSGAEYVVTTEAGSKQTVEFKVPTVAMTQTIIVIPATVVVNGTQYEVTSIADKAFKDNTTVTSITIGENVETIGESAFEGCTSLTSITIPASVSTIGDSAFKGCSKLKTATLSKGVTEIGTKAFANCTSLTKVSVPSTVTKIGDQAFSGDKKLKSATIGNNVTEIGDKAFANCSSLISITIPKKVNKLGANVFKGAKKLKTITVKNTKLNSKNVSKNAFKGISNKTVIKVPKSKKKAYTTLFRKKGLSKKVKIK